MKKGKQVGEYSSRLTSIRVIADDEGKSLIEMSFEGKSATGPTGFDFIGTVTCLAGKIGTYKYQGAVYLEDGDIHSSVGKGKYEGWPMIVGVLRVLSRASMVAAPPSSKRAR